MENTNKFMEELDKFWEDLENDKLEFSEEENQLAKDIIKLHPGAFGEDS